MMWDDIRSAFSFLTILPFGFPEGRKTGWSMAWYPLVGLFIGGVLIGVAEVSPFNRELTAFLVLFSWVFITGGLHLDGFGDSCDGLLATVSPARRLDIMKDPRTGSWAVVGLILLLLAKWQAIQHVPLELLILPPVMGRWAMVLAVYSFPYARQEGIGSFFRDGLTIQHISIATLIAFVIASRLDFAMLMISMFCFTWLFGKWSASRLDGGITGDVYGAICELTELLCLLVIGASYG
jgi:adenosylcobinamide-GDP ribazoletransferase